MTLDFQNRSVERTGAITPARRGPLRPSRLFSVRRRQDQRFAGHRFRAVDTIFLLAVAVLFLRQTLDLPVVEAPLAEIVPVAAAIWSIWFVMRPLRLYRFGRRERLIAHLALVVAATIMGAALATVAYLVLPVDQVRLDELLAMVGVCGAGLAILHLTWWGLVARWRSLGLLTPNVVVVGATNHAEHLIATALERRDMHILGVFDDREERSPLAVSGVPLLGTTDAMLRHRIMPYVDLIVVAIDQSAAARVRQIMDRLSVLPNSVTLMFDSPASDRRAEAVDRIANAPLTELHTSSDPSRRAFAKRIQDLVIGVPVLMAFALPMLLVALAIRLDSRGPVFFRQGRQGFNNEEIRVWKFRTMRHEDADPHAVRQVTEDDERVTRVGRILRKTSIDEIPQLFNVIAGEMSLVGPRPHAIGMKTGDVESAELVAEYAHRHRIKPGMTGWAAVNGSRGPLHEPEEVCRRVSLDISYIERQSFWLDLQIMAKTVPSMLGDRDAVR